MLISDETRRVEIDMIILKSAWCHEFEREVT